MADPTLTDIADKIDDVGRMLARQSATLGDLAGAGSRTSGPDVPLLVELHALRVDALACAATARSRRERAAFEATAAGLERLLNGRGGRVIVPRAGEPFSSTTMDAVEVVATEDAAQDRTVAVLREPGLQVGGRNVRPARVAVHRHTP
ncbi:nucleotide exchange factor GrpE [Pseudonocardia sp. 73-21]|uniref:nucleotide exchange factor GrpE n=1 Tax=Pseudonocardia sp. 73-21 TaxID=1895809 RepID=UPI00095F1D75|nr:nucleotide exchange factor GrpE [Pseudonocardia sp. 73-21]OJY40018.1 MAG: nucleotide exchange factor GrpE [Pseudonocardia sp. 73-21]